jgi:ATP-dependent Lon protease
MEQDQLAEAFHLAERSNLLRLSFEIAALEDFSVKEKQRFLEMTSTAERIKKGVQALSRIVERARLTNEINTIIGGNGSLPRRLIEVLSAEKQDQP